MYIYKKETLCKCVREGKKNYICAFVHEKERAYTRKREKVVCVCKKMRERKCMHAQIFMCYVCAFVYNKRKHTREQEKYSERV